MVRAAHSQCYDQFHLVVQVVRRWGIGHVLAASDECVGRLHEEERRLTVRVVTHLAGMLGVVASHAVDPPHRE